MPARNLQHFLDDDYEFETERRGRRPQSDLWRRSSPRRSDHAMLDEMVRYGAVSAEAAEGIFTPTFTSSRHEREWILNYLGPFYDRKQIVDVLHKVKGGKEANVYCCQAHPGTGLGLVAAKVYRPRMFRNLRNDALYRQGRAILDDAGKVVRDGRLLHAIATGTRRGKDAQHTAWLEHEYQTMAILHAAGADVPQPLASSANTVLMEYLGDAQSGAPTLNQVTLPAEEAQPLFDRLLWNVELMLARGRIHGDLSAYNVLYWQGRGVIIDLPQAVDPAVNRAGRALLRRDLQRLCEYFARHGIECDAAALADDLWARHGPDEIEMLPEFVEQEDGWQPED